MTLIKSPSYTLAIWLFGVLCGLLCGLLVLSINLYQPEMVNYY